MACALQSANFPAVIALRAEWCFSAASFQATELRSTSSLLQRSGFAPWNPLSCANCSALKPLPPWRLSDSASGRINAPAALVSWGYGNARNYDPELRLVLELATNAELCEIESILYGPSYFSPILKSMTSRPNIDHAMDVEDVENRESLIELLESRFLFLAADARSTLRGWRPSYRDVLLCVRKKLGVPCSGRLPTEDLEVEIFLHMLNKYSSFKASTNQGTLEIGLSKWKIGLLAAIKVGAKELQQVVWKAGGILSVAKFYQLLAKKLSGKVIIEAANYQIKSEVIKRGGQFAALSLESRAALLASRQGLAHAASRYLGLRSVMMLLGPVLWGTFLADVLIQMLGTDHARVLRAIYAFAQIRLTRTFEYADAKN